MARLWGLAAKRGGGGGAGRQANGRQEGKQKGGVTSGGWPPKGKLLKCGDWAPRPREYTTLVVLGLGSRPEAAMCVTQVCELIGMPQQETIQYCPQLQST